MQFQTEVFISWSSVQTKHFKNFDSLRKLDETWQVSVNYRGNDKNRSLKYVCSLDMKKICNSLKCKITYYKRKIGSFRSAFLSQSHAQDNFQAEYRFLFVLCARSRELQKFNWLCCTPIFNWSGGSTCRERRSILIQE